MARATIRVRVTFSVTGVFVSRRFALHIVVVQPKLTWWSRVRVEGLV